MTTTIPSSAPSGGAILAAMRSVPNVHGVATSCHTDTLGATSPARTFYAGMAWLFVVVAVVGFAPRSLAIVSGTMKTPPLVVHLHAAVMASWVSLLADHRQRCPWWDVWTCTEGGASPRSSSRRWC